MSEACARGTGGEASKPRIQLDELVVDKAVKEILALARLGMRHSVWIRLPGTGEVLKINARLMPLAEADRLIVKENEE